MVIIVYRAVKLLLQRDRFLLHLLAAPPTPRRLLVRLVQHHIQIRNLPLQHVIHLFVLGHLLLLVFQLLNLLVCTEGDLLHILQHRLGTRKPLGQSLHRVLPLLLLLLILLLLNAIHMD